MLVFPVNYYKLQVMLVVKKILHNTVIIWITAAPFWREIKFLPVRGSFSSQVPASGLKNMQIHDVMRGQR